MLALTVPVPIPDFLLDGSFWAGVGSATFLIVGLIVYWMSTVKFDVFK